MKLTAEEEAVLGDERCKNCTHPLKLHNDHCCSYCMICELQRQLNPRVIACLRGSDGDPHWSEATNGSP